MVLSLGQGKVVGVHAIFHEGDAAALVGTSHHEERSGGWSTERVSQVIVIVAVHLNDRYVERSQLVHEEIEVGDFLRRPESLESVQVDDGGQVRQLLVS